MKSYRSLDVISFHPGRQHNLEQAAQLSRYFESFRHLTSLFFTPQIVSKIAVWFPALARKLQKRSFAVGHKRTVRSFSPPELYLLLKRFFNKNLGYKDFIRRNLRFQIWVLSRYNPPGITIGYDGSSWKVFEKWKGKSFLILDLAVAVPEYKRKLIEYAGFNEARAKQLIGDDEYVYNIYRKELALADLILCGSEFVRNSCLALGVQSDKLVVLPYGVDTKLFKPQNFPYLPTIYVRICFIGNICYRKGADILLRVWPRIKKKFINAELHFFGNKQIPISPEPEGTFYHGFVSQKKLISEMQASDIAVLPSFFEGSSIALYQAMSVGMAVVATPNSGSIISHGENGMLVEYGDEEALFETLSFLIDNEKERKRLGANALKEVGKYSWDEYGNRLAGILYEKMNSGKARPVPVFSEQGLLSY